MNIKNITDRAFYQMEKFKQKTIDLIEDVEEDVFNSEDELSKDKIGSYLYKIDTFLEVYNPNLTDDIKILKDLEVLLKNKKSNSRQV